jgi:DNA polymerase III alpha subunit (gram-positive type)
MLAGAPAPGEVLPEFLSFTAGSCLCSYNMPFDLGFLENELRLSGLPSVESMPKIDMLTVARKILPRLDRHALWFVARHLGVPDPQEHRAMADVMMMWAVFGRLKPLLREMGISTFGALSAFAGNARIRNQQQVQERLVQIQRAIDIKTSFTMRYISVRDGKETVREVTPRELRRDRGQWYVIGFCSLKREERMFKVDNIAGLSMSGEI